MKTQTFVTQAIRTKYLPATNVRGSRVKATCQRGSVTVDWRSDLNADDNHINAVHFLVAKFVKEDAKRHKPRKNPWSATRVAGVLPDGSYAHVYID